MALIACGECGRAVSDKAAACIGCGAPLNDASSIDLAPRPTKAAPPTRAQIRRRTLLAAATFGCGVISAALLDRRFGASRLASFLAAMLIIAGLCGLLVLLVYAAAARRGR
ncbi:MAG TPA: hypothetical protein VND80_09715 [Steroidobacteraceae bacterium]|nr:hypothetical protein [Steroidobacteraceae bacterium]